MQTAITIMHTHPLLHCAAVVRASGRRRVGMQLGAWCMAADSVTTLLACVTHESDYSAVERSTLLGGVRPLLRRDERAEWREQAELLV